MEIKAVDVAKLRKMTGAGMMDCKKALVEANGDYERAKEIILNDMKTEIHTLATLNDVFIGCIHKQLSDRHMLYDGDFASEGCIPQKTIDGVLKVTVLVFNVIKDNTRYQLTVSGE